MGRGKQGPGGPHFGDASKGRGGKGPMMDRRGPGRGHHLGRGMHGSQGPSFGRASMARGPKGPMMSPRGPKACPDGKCPAVGPKSEGKERKAGDKKAKKPVRPKKPTEKKQKAEPKPEPKKPAGKAEKSEGDKPEDKD